MIFCASSKLGTKSLGIDDIIERENGFKKGRIDNNIYRFSTGVGLRRTRG